MKGIQPRAEGGIARGAGQPEVAQPTMLQFTKYTKRLLFVAGDVAAVLAANLLAVVLRFDFAWSAIARPTQRTLELLFIDLFVTPVAFYATGLYQGYWKYAGLNDLLRLMRAIGYRTVAVIVIFYGLGFYGLSRAVLIMSTFLLLFIAGALRLTPRFRSEFSHSRRRQAGHRALIIGAGDTGESLLRELKRSARVDYDPIGFVDDDREKAGAKIHGVPVVGETKNLEKLILDHGVRDVIIAIPGASRSAMREIFEVCRRTGAHFRMVPTRGELERGAARVSQIRLVDIEDLLRREVVSLNQQTLRDSLNGQRVLITGAAGSIGRELARQIAAYEPEELIALDRNENNLFYLEMELREAHPLLGLTPVVGDVLDRPRLEHLFRTARPDIVFHAAAYKHVPLMEGHPLEAIKNNVIGTRHLAEVAADAGVERFIFISTDKAVRPTSVMGATKRLGERLIKSIETSRTRFMAVRFGNVLGSDGSVVPTFRRQIASGGPVTVTHKDTTRYFMTIPEAVQLVLMAGAMGEGGEIFLLQMGEPVRIVDLARNLIELSGLRPDEDVKIVFTGLRPGEKLHEDLKSDAEMALPTSNDKIVALTGIEVFREEDWRAIEDLQRATLEGRMDDSLAVLRSLVPDYVPPKSPARTVAPPQRIVGIGARRRPDVQV